jgi:short-subunit dehydrogenase
MKTEEQMILLPADEYYASNVTITTWLVVGATRGIGLEFVRQLLQRGDRVLATTREVAKASQLWTLAGASPAAACRLLECDVTREESVLVGDVSPVPPRLI